MKILKKFNEFNEKISVAFQTSHSNRLGPGYNWNISQSGPISHPRLILNDFISEYGEAQLAKDELGYYLLVKINTNKQIEDLPQKYQGLRVVKRYNENFELEEEEGLNILEGLPNAEEIIEYLESTFTGFKPHKRTYKSDRLNDDSIYYIKNDKIGFTYDKNKKSITVEKENYHPLIGMTSDNNSRYRAMMVLKWYLSATYNIDVEIVFELGGNDFFDPTKMWSGKLIPIMESFDLFDTHSVEELIILLEYYIEVLVSNDHNLDKAPNDYQSDKHKGKLFQPIVDKPDKIDPSSLSDRLYTVCKDYLEGGKEILRSGITDFCKEFKYEPVAYFGYFTDDLTALIQKWSAYGTFNKEDIRYDYRDKELKCDTDIDKFNYITWQSLYSEIHKLLKKIKTIN